MNRRHQLSPAAKRYLYRFYEILNEMIKNMTGAPLTDSISHNFIVQMIPHHRAAIEMSENLLMYTDFEPLKRIAENIIEEQTKGIENMEKALTACEELSNTRQDLCRYKNRLDRITSVMFSNMRNARASNNINADFMREMIPHHKGAVQMSENALQYPICPELTPILQSIISSQEKGIQDMANLLRQLNC